MAPRRRVPPTPERLRLDALATNYLTVKEAARVAHRACDADELLFVDALLDLCRDELLAGISPGGAASHALSGPRFRIPA